MEAAIFDIDLVAAQLLQLIAGRFNLIRESIRQSDELHVRRRAEAVIGRSAAASAAADEADADDVIARRMHVGKKLQVGGQRQASRYGGRRLQEIAPRGGSAVLTMLVGHVIHLPLKNVNWIRYLLSRVTFDRKPFRLSCSASGRTTRKPTKSASVSRRMLCGRCGSRRIHVLSEPRRAALRRRAASSAHEPPRATWPKRSATRQEHWLQGHAILRKSRVVVLAIMIQAPFRHVAIHIVKTPRVGLFLSDRVRQLLRIARCHA